MIHPAVTVALGATAAPSLTGKAVTIGGVRRSPLTLADGGECRVTERAKFLADLKRIRDRAEKLAS